MPASGRVDLHLHTTHSDGYYPTEELVARAVRQKLDVISITDHDTVAAYPEVYRLCAAHGIEVIPGVELSTDVADREVHILAYFIDTTNPDLLNYLEFFRKERMKRAERILKKLKNLNVEISMDDVLAESKAGVVGRPHIAQALMRKGYCKTFNDAFARYLGNQAPAYERKVHVSPSSAFTIISEAGGLSFVAHPANMDEAVMRELIESGVDGIEVTHPSHNQQQSAYYRGVANNYFLLTCGGSDFHGGKRSDEGNLGKYIIGHQELKDMRNALLKHSA